MVKIVEIELARGLFHLSVIKSFNLADGFPAVTTKSLAWKGVVSELLWFRGSDDERRLAEIRFKKDRSELTDLSSSRPFGQQCRQSRC